MQVSYSSKKIEKSFSDIKTKSNKLLFKNIQKVFTLIDTYDNMEDLNKDFGILNIHPLKGDKYGEWTIKVYEGYRLIFKPVNENNEFEDIREMKEIRYIRIIKEISNHYE
jgi:plasmid maintenance system killer protein